MLKRLKSVSMMLLLMGVPAGTAFAATNPMADEASVTQQNVDCKGVVKDSSGEPVIGASVVVRGTQNGTIQV